MTDTTIPISEARKRLHEIVRQDISFDEKARQALELGRQFLGVDGGFLTKIHIETDRWDAKITTDRQASPTSEMNLWGTYCRETIENDAPLAIHDASNQGWADDPAFEISDHETYLGTPLIPEGEPYGTVCFVAADPRSEPFSDVETQFVDHLTRLLERELEHKLELDAIEERYATLLEAAPDPVFVADAETGKIIEINEAAETLLGEPRDQIIGRHQSSLHPADDAELYHEAFERAKKGRQTIQTLSDGSRPKLVTADGETIPLEISVNIVSLPDGPVIHGIFRDISIRDEREELRQVIDLVPDPIFAKTRDGKYLLANETTARAYGLSPEEVEGKQESDLLPDARDAKGFQGDDLEVIETGEPKEIAEEELTTADGETKILETTKIPYEIPGSGEDAVLGYARDITELKEYQQAIEEQRDNLEVLSKVVRHDIRNDLQMVLAYGETLENYVEDGGQEYVRQLLEAAREAVDITSTARDIAEVLLQQDAEQSTIALHRVIEGEVEEIRSSNEQAIVTVGSLPHVQVLADDLLQSVFRNLLKNAIVHNDKEIPEITISGTKTDETVRIKIADNGPGVPDAQKKEIFEEGQTALDSDSTGLGLYLVETLVNRYDGDVKVEDNEPEGSVFVVELPLGLTTTGW